MKLRFAAVAITLTVMVRSGTCAATFPLTQTDVNSALKYGESRDYLELLREVPSFKASHETAPRFTPVVKFYSPYILIAQSSAYAKQKYEEPPKALIQSYGDPKRATFKMSADFWGPSLANMLPFQDAAYVLFQGGTQPIKPARKCSEYNRAGKPNEPGAHLVAIDCTYLASDVHLSQPFVFAASPVVYYSNGTSKRGELRFEIDPSKSK